MSGNGSCEDTRELAAELALGIADGEARAKVLEHVAVCAECQRELERLSALADGLLELAPEREPPVGFELRVLDAMQPLSSTEPFERRRLRLPRRVLPLAAALAAAVVVTAGGLLYAVQDDRHLADHYRATLTEAHGSYFGAARLHDDAGKAAGVLFVYRGSPSWLMVTVDPPYRATARRVELVGADGRVIPIPWPRLTQGAWGGSLPVDLGAVESVRLVSKEGRVLLATTMPETRP